jgi:hypothetical protein
MSQAGQVEAAASGAASRGSKTAAAEAEGERFTPLLTREAHTFAQMRSDRRGPRMYSAICFPGWKKD